MHRPRPWTRVWNAFRPLWSSLHEGEEQRDEETVTSSDNRVLGFLAMTGLAVTAVLSLIGLVLIYTAGLEPQRRAEGLCAKAGLPSESQELGLCIEHHLHDSVVEIGMPWIALAVTALVLTVVVVEVTRRRMTSKESVS